MMTLQPPAQSRALLAELLADHWDVLITECGPLIYCPSDDNDFKGALLDELEDLRIIEVIGTSFRLTPWGLVLAQLFYQPQSTQTKGKTK